MNVNTNLQCQGLPPQQTAVLLYSAMGWCAKRIARELSISARTVKCHREALMCKLGAANTTQSVALAFAKGYLRYLPVLLLCVVSAFGMSHDARPVRRPMRSVAHSRIVSRREVC